MTDVDHDRQMESLRIALSRDLVRLTARVAEVVERMVTRQGEAPCERPDRAGRALFGYLLTDDLCPERNRIR